MPGPRSWAGAWWCIGVCRLLAGLLPWEALPEPWWLPPLGFSTPRQLRAGHWQQFSGSVRHLVLPAPRSGVAQRHLRQRPALQTAPGAGVPITVERPQPGLSERGCAAATPCPMPVCRLLTITGSRASLIGPALLIEVPTPGRHRFPPTGGDRPAGYPWFRGSSCGGRAGVLVSVRWILLVARAPIPHQFLSRRRQS